jgi:hypothetical protein
LSTSRQEQVKEPIMMLALLAIVQTASPPDPERTPRASVDLPQAWRPGSCPKDGGGDDIVVCGSRDAAEKFRVRPLPQKYGPVGGPGVGVALGDGLRGNVHAEPGRMGDAQAMVTITKAF